MADKIKTMQMKQSKQELVPKLRFPEFEDDGKWGEKALGDVANFFKGKGLPKSIISLKAKKPCIHYGELFTDYQEVISSVKSFTDLDTDLFLSLQNDVLMPTSDVTPRGLAKSCCIKISDVILGGDILVIRTDESQINGEFLSRLIRNRELQVLQLVSGSTVFHLYASSMKKLILAFPNIAEQQKIADCLSSIDDLITAESEKLESIKNHKKGLMQNLFPSEGKTIPNFRFPEFQNDGKWGEKALGDVAIKKSSNIAANKIEENSGEYFIYGASGILKKVDFYEEENDYISIVKDGAGVGRILYCKGKSSVLGTLEIIKPKKNLDTYFLYCLLENISFAKYVTGATIPHIYFKDYSTEICQVPPIEEQQKIADCLSSVDDLITSQEQKIDALKTHKKGLMQQLFPNINEVLR
jgi:type I restriction enzyme S subunit